MKQLKYKLLNRAIEKHDNITPCAEHKDFSDCYTIANNMLCLWYNTVDGNTHMLSEIIE